MKKRLLFLLTAFVMLFNVPMLASAYFVGEEVPITYQKRFLPFDTPYVNYIAEGGQVFVSNAPESIYSDGAERADGSLIAGQVNATLYRDTVGGSFRFWGSHYNRSSTALKFWIHITNTENEPVRLYRSLEGFAVGEVTAAASKATLEFMNSESQPTLLHTIPAGSSYYFEYTADQPVDLSSAVVYFAEFRAEKENGGEEASILLSHVVTDDSVTDPTSYAETPTIARTNATATRSDDYRGLLEHWGRKGTIELELDDQALSAGVKIADLGYSGEQEKLMTRWNTMGEPIEQSEVRFVVPPNIDKIRLAYWYTDYVLDVRLVNNTSYSKIHTMHGSAGFNPGFINYQLNDSTAYNFHFSRETAVPVTTDMNYRLRLMVMPSAYLPFGIYFVAGDEEIPLDLAVVQAENTFDENDWTEAQTIVNAMPDGEIKTALLIRLQQLEQKRKAALQAVAQAESEVAGIEQELSQLNDKLQNTDFAVDKKERERLIQLLEAERSELQEWAKNTGQAIQLIPDKDKPGLSGIIVRLTERMDRTLGWLDSISIILEEAKDNDRKGNGNTEFRLSISRGDTVNLFDPLEDRLIQLLGSVDELQWLSMNPFKVTVDGLGHVTANENGVYKVIVYNDKGKADIFLVVNSKSH
ncbi:hypothetical protein [Paenibacillus sp. J2TS4]|uniref:hypothetical protein n=1 Tax=Paenibacillus sp. J2TS4 TaxID=2807194 RepID=UPI001B0FBE5A|nr:hypothetical protein [Paenibacillus sp. J2TS4]GIP31546.1 hypothetical protein J2TS4_07560 [Paenibacillus sp. J2TS4]